ncbi:MAG: hypothetical protein CL811_06380 [Colwelliaceae bacterium]|jgi:hypothetical protein|nr:hypothetical protein [Colwelliaceae bacterium]|tara:strand:- start:708 stop:2366 length:1659 start_codon:yes stop_codon:yes gene_type:complete
MILDEITEENFEERRVDGQEELDKKFNAWDRLGKLDIKLAEFKAKAAWMMRDPSIWAYATLKDKENKPLRVYPFQDKLINDKNRFVHVHAANQVGKTWSAAVIKGLHHAFHVNNASVMIISSKEDQAISILDEMKWIMKRARINFEEFKDNVDNRTELHIHSPDKVGTSVIRTFPPTTAILGYPSTLTIMDEDNFWEKIGDLSPVDYYDQCIEPRSNATKNWKHPFLTMGQIVGISNPNGQQGLGWRCLNDPRYHNYIYNWLANPQNNIQEYQEAKNRLPPYRFASIYAATYMSVDGGFISFDQYEQFASYNHPLVIPPGCNLYLGGDFASEDAKGKNRDWNVIYGVVLIPHKEKGFAPHVQVVYLKEWAPNTNKQVIYDELRKLVNSNINVVKFGYDKVGVGDKIKNDLIDRGIMVDYQIEPLTYSLPNKSEVFINMQSLFEHGQIQGRDIPKLKEQMMGLRVEQPIGSVHLKIHHKTEGIKDDHPDALANACYMAKRSGGFGVDLTVIPHAEKKIIEPETELRQGKGTLAYCEKCEDYHWENQVCNLIAT